MPDVGTDERPLLIIHNKYNVEWDVGPINHIPLVTLETMFHLLKHDFTIVDIRHGIAPKDPGFSDDHNTSLPFEDRELLDCHPEVFCFDDLYAAHRVRGGNQDLNTFKNVLYSRCLNFVSSQGGGAHQIALFSGFLLLILHRRGSEESWAYGDGYYGFMATVPPIRVICSTEDKLLRAVPLFLGAVVSEDRVLLGPGDEQLLAELSPWAIAPRSP